MNLLDNGFESNFDDDVGKGYIKYNTYDDLQRLYGNAYFGAFNFLFNFLPIDTAAKNLSNFRSATGEPMTYSDNEISKFPDILSAMDKNRTRFESATFTGISRDGEIAKKYLA